MMDHEGGLCGFNLAFDHFHLCQTYTTLSLFPDKNAIPEHHINEIALLEPLARDGKCLKPKKAFDVMLHARKGPYQSTMDRGDIQIKKVPNILSKPLADLLEREIKLKDIYFAKRKNKYAPRWNIYDIEDDPDFKDIVLKFRPSSALKALAVDALNIKEDNLILYGDVEIHEYPEEIGFAPFALAVAPNYLQTKDWKNAWPEKIHLHINHWAANKYARQYAEDDVKYTRDLYKYFGSPESDDDDSNLACAIGASRWRGFKIDIEGIKKLRLEAIAASKSAPTAPSAVKRYVLDLLNEEERICLQDDSTSKEVLKAISEFNTKCPECIYDITEETSNPLRLGCNNENCVNGKILHPAAINAQKVIDARSAKKEIELYDKLILAGRFHASFNIIGALSSRMSGTDGLNPQGIKATTAVRSCFPLAMDGDCLLGGDFESFEVCLADAAYNDPKLREDLQKGVSVHGVFGSFVYAPMTYDEIMASKGTSNDKYKASKNCLFSVLYGAEAYTLENKYQVSAENAQKGYELFLNNYPVLARERKRIQDMFCVTDDTWTMTKEGPRQVKDLINKNCTIIVNGRYQFTNGFFYTGQKEIFELETKEGYKLQATADHPILTNYYIKKGVTNGSNIYIQLKDLKLNDTIYINKHKNIEWEGDGSFEDGYILGWLYGDGSCAEKNENDNRLYFYPDDFIMIEYVKKLFKNEPESKYIEANNCYYLRSNEIKILKERFGIDNKKIINEYIEKASSEFYEGFLSGFFDTDGSPYDHIKWINFTQSDILRIEAIQRMLLRLGIRSSFSKIKKVSNTILGRTVKVKDAYSLYIGAENVITFKNRIGFRNYFKQDKMNKAINKCDKKKLYKEYYLVHIKNITSIGIKDTYDINVPELNCFDANGIVVHNCSMVQHVPHGKVEWKEPADKIESLLGFPRYFTLENMICKALFNIAENPPKEWLKLKINVIRRDREQSITGAVRSALFAAAFALQAANMRAAGNHVIQSTGAVITKGLQRKIWDLQPSGINDWLVQPFNCHDEIEVSAKPHMVPEIRKVVTNYINVIKEKVPLIAIDWKDKMNTWADK